MLLVGLLLIVLRNFYNRNDVDAEIARSAQLGANYYTLTYQPENVDPDGKFRRVRVTLRDPSLHAITKAGYYAPDEKAVIDVQQQQIIKLADAIQAAIPFDALEVNLANVVRHPDSRTAEFTVVLHSKNLDFLPTQNGKDSVPLTVAAASLTNDRNILASRIEYTTLSTSTLDPARLPTVATHFPIVVPYPKRTRTIRVVVEDRNGGRIGTAELDRKSIDGAPEAPTPPLPGCGRPTAPAGMGHALAWLAGPAGSGGSGDRGAPGQTSGA